MIFKRFRFNVVIRVLIISGISLFLKYALAEQSSWLMTNLFTMLVLVIATAELIYYVEKTNRDLESFLLAIKHRDYTHTFTRAKRGKSFASLHFAFNQVIKGYQVLRAEKESHHQYLQNVVEHVSVALLCYSSKTGSIQLMNRAAKRLLDRPYMSNIKIMRRVDPLLLETILRLENGERQLVKSLINEELLQIAVQATEFKLQDDEYKLISLQDIKEELDEQEVASWHKLIRVLTHEIMNSVTPIISLTKALNNVMVNPDGKPKALEEIGEESAEDIRIGFRTIENRSKGLLHFVHAYRNLTRIPQPNFRQVEAAQMLQRIYRLMKPEFDRHAIDFGLQLPSHSLSTQADPELIEQVLINLVKNALEALSFTENAQVQLSAHRNHEGKTVLSVKDNGSGIDKEFQDKIFIPFFTTKKQGSGIGLSLSRQIMRLHKGSISFHSTPQEGTTFYLTL